MKTLPGFLCSVMLLCNSTFATEVPSSNIFSKSNSEITVAQNMFGYLRVHRQGKGVSINWGTTSMSGIAYFIIERSYDGEFFDPIHQVTMNGSNRQTWLDASVFPGYIHYRIVCVLTDGTEYYSETDTVRIVQRG